MCYVEVALKSFAFHSNVAERLNRFEIYHTSVLGITFAKRGSWNLQCGILCVPKFDKVIFLSWCTKCVRWPENVCKVKTEITGHNFFRSMLSIKFENVATPSQIRNTCIKDMVEWSQNYKTFRIQQNQQEKSFPFYVVVLH